jgi:hypothetical protein
MVCLSINISGPNPTVSKVEMYHCISIKYTRVAEQLCNKIKCYENENYSLFIWMYAYIIYYKGYFWDIYCTFVVKIVANPPKYRPILEILVNISSFLVLKMILKNNSRKLFIRNFRISDQNSEKVPILS